MVRGSTSWYLNCKSAQNNGAENGISEDAVKHVPLSMDLAGIDLIEELHHDECVEYNGVVLRWRGMQRSISAAVNIKDLLTWTENTTQNYL